MLQLENPQNQAMEYALDVHRVEVEQAEKCDMSEKWDGVLVPPDVHLATDARNPLKKYY